MDDLNRVMTPLELFEEDLQLPLELAARQRQMVKRSVEESPAPFVIGSINLMNEKIQHLSGTLQAHPAVLLVETRARDSARPASTHPEKLRQQVVEKFPVIQVEKRPKSKRSDVKPKLVELQQYPGFSAQGPTPLPNDTTLHQISDNLLQAHGQLKKQAGYLAELQELLSSTLMQDLLLDTFWWFFLHLYQTNYSVQCQLFDRISKNYVELIMKTQSSSYGDRFLQELSSTLSQAVYTSFCCSFPQSWIQFHNNDFKSQVCNIVYQWVGGLRPVPKIYNNWNCDALLPQEVKDMKFRPALDTDEDKRGVNMSFSDFNPPSRVSLDSGSTGSKKTSSTSSSSERSAQRKPISASPRLSRNSLSKGKRNSRVHRISSSGLPEVDSYQFDEAASSSFGSQQSVSKVTANNYGFVQVSPHKQSHVAGRGPEFMKNLFNVFGHSPLVLNFLQRLNLEPQTGKVVYVTRTEIQSLPRDDAPTYSDVIEAGYQNLLKLKEMKEKLSQQQPSGAQQLAQSS